MSLMYIAFFEVVAVVWIYGAGRLAGNVADMTGSPPNLYVRVGTLFTVFSFYCGST